MGSLRKQLNLYKASEYCKEQIDTVISDPRLMHFKIGMSADNPEDRKPGYLSNGEYSDFKILFSNREKDLIIELEKLLITHYKATSEKCDNDQVGGGELAGEQNPYIYIAVQHRINRLSTRSM